MPIISGLSAGARAVGIYIVSILVFVTDTFNRADNATDLGSIANQKWKIWRGAWQILTNKAYSATTPSTNALATLKFTKTDVTVSISGQDPGMGAAFWVTDANNWYASVYTQTQVCQTCVNCAFGSAYNATYCSGTYNAATCNANCCNGFFPFWSPYCSGAYNCNGYNACNIYACNVYNSANTGNRTTPYGFCYGPNRYCASGQLCITGNCNNSPGNCNVTGIFCCAPTSTYLTPGNCNQYTAGTCNSYFSYSCNCTTEYRVNLLSSIAGTISTISQNLFSAAIASFKTALSGNQATITAYSAVNYVTQIGSPAATTISPAPVKTRQHGIIKSSSPYSQGTSIDDFGVN